MVDLNRAAPKTDCSFDRTVSLDDVEALVPFLRKRFGITRVGEITNLDRIGIPVVTAIVPKSRDALGVYNGKGRSRREAALGAVLEACERQAAASFNRCDCELTPDEISALLDLDALGLFADRENDKLPCATGFDLLKECEVPVPLALIRTPWDGSPTFPSTNTNGIAAGATLIDALYHALSELVERHVWSMTHLRAHVMPRRLLAGSDLKTDLPIASEIRQPTGRAAVDALVTRVHAAGLSVRLLALREKYLPISVHASIVDEGADTILHAFGIGTSWSPVHAAVRAITEAAQSRVVDIQGAREDIQRREIRRDGLWYFNGPAQCVDFAELEDRSRDDVAAEVRMLLVAIRNVGAKAAVAVDVTPPEVPIHVVRIVAPELESYLVDRRIGRIAQGTFSAAFERLPWHM